jgi:hypothetical protein
MAASKRPKRKKIGHIAGKNPDKSLDVGLTGSKYTSGGAKPRGKKGAIIRKPVPAIHYKKKSS